MVVMVPKKDDSLRMCKALPLCLYIAATGQVINTVLTVEREEEGKAYKVQRPVYYISEVMTPSKQRYPHYQKLVYGIYMTTKKVAHCFLDHSVIVVSDAPLSEILHKQGCNWSSGKMGD